MPYTRPTVPEGLAAHLYMRLVLDATLKDLIGDKLFKARAEQDIKPPMVLYRLSRTVYESDLDGVTGEAETEVEFEIFARTDDECKQIAEAIFNRLVGYSGTLASREITEVAPVSGTEDEYSEELDITQRILVLLVSHRRSGT